jgi:hypothetical protein
VVSAAFLLIVLRLCHLSGAAAGRAATAADIQATTIANSTVRFIDLSFE